MSSEREGNGMSMEPQTTDRSEAQPTKKSGLVPIFIAAGVLAIAVSGYAMFERARAKTNHVALDAEAKPVSMIEPHAASFRATRRYVATIEPWLRAKIGPQLVSAYVDTVLFRPGAVVKKGDVLATLDCKTASTQAQAAMMAARALEAKQAAIAKEASRLNAMLDGGFVSENEAEKKQAEAATQAAEILAAKAKLAGESLEVNDCILRSPFDGEVDVRTGDPGAFAKPGTSILSIVDRSTVRVSADVPETDFAHVAPGTSVRIKVLATGASLTGTISRRAPSADLATRTVHFEIDVQDPQRTIPVGTTAELGVDVGEPIPAIEIPLAAAAVRGEKATVFVVKNGVAKKTTVNVLGESGGSLYVDESLKGEDIVTEGRALLSDGDKVNAKLVASAEAPKSAPSVAAHPSGEKK